jgi:CBS domain-containing protein
MRARDIMTTDVLTVGRDTPVRQIAALLLERRISGVPVVDANCRVVGMVSEADLMHRAENRHCAIKVALARTVHRRQ